MCPPVLVLALLDITIGDSWSDEELVRFVADRKAGDPLPQNVLTDVDLSVIDPRDSPENIWYLNRSNDQPPYDNGKNGIRKAKNGYWKPMAAFRVPTSTAIAGVKVSLEFYEGQAPSGKRTGWMMHEYQLEQNDGGANVPQDYKSLCRVFLQRDRRLNADHQQIPLHAGAPNDDLESYLLYLAEIEEKNVATNSQIVAANDQNVSSIKGQDEQKTHSAADDIPVPYDFSNEDYIEINDLLSPEASVSTSEYSSRRSMISEEYFDSDALLREILDDHNTTEKEHTDRKFSIAAPTKSDHVVIGPSEQGLVHSHDSNAMAAGTSMENSVPGGGREQHSNAGCPPSSHVKRSHSDSSQRSTKSSQRDRSIRKFANIGKKYCCFGSF